MIRKKWVPVFRKDHAQSKRQNGMTIEEKSSRSRATVQKSCQPAFPLIARNTGRDHDPMQSDHAQMSPSQPLQGTMNQHLRPEPIPFIDLAAAASPARQVRR